MKIYSPVKGYDGDAAGVIFKNGVAEADDLSESAKAYFERKGYTIEGFEQQPQLPLQTPQEPEQPQEIEEISEVGEEKPKKK